MSIIKGVGWCDQWQPMCPLCVPLREKPESAPAMVPPLVPSGPSVASGPGQHQQLGASLPRPQLPLHLLPAQSGHRAVPSVCCLVLRAVQQVGPCRHPAHPCQGPRLALASWCFLSG